jgi:hypothetical protein
MKVAFITAILGNYELTCKPFVEQTIDTDFICFTDNINIPSNGWIVDTTPYWKEFPSKVDDGLYINSTNKSEKLTRWAEASSSDLLSNLNNFNLAKYYKQAWHNIPRLKEYDVVIWLDGTVQITAADIAEYMIELCAKYDIVSWQHELRAGHLAWEAFGSYLSKYTSREYAGKCQPYQDVIRQYHDYIRDGYDEDFWVNYPRKEGRGDGMYKDNHFGVWLTCFVAFNNRNDKVKDFLDRWYLQTLKYTTQDQVSFPKVVQDTGIVPYTLPDTRFTGDYPHVSTSIFIKQDHQK